jgi:hypothetical protein
LKLDYLYVICDELNTFGPGSRAAERRL